MKKGKLHKIEDTWIVEYSDYDFTGMPVVGTQIPLHPGPLPLPEGMGIDDYLYEGHEIDFVVVNGSSLGIVEYAKPIIPKIVPNNGIPTSEEFLNANWRGKGLKLNVNGLMIEFAKLHLESQAKAIYEKAKINMFQDNEGITVEVDKDSILNAYSLDNIK